MRNKSNWFNSVDSFSCFIVVVDRASTVPILIAHLNMYVCMYVV